MAKRPRPAAASAARTIPQQQKKTAASRAKPAVGPGRSADEDTIRRFAQHIQRDDDDEGKENSDAESKSSAAFHEADDDEIDSDEAFNSEDERKWGSLFDQKRGYQKPPKGSTARIVLESGDEASSTEASGLEEDASSEAEQRQLKGRGSAPVAALVSGKRPQQPQPQQKPAQGATAARKAAAVDASRAAHLPAGVGTPAAASTAPAQRSHSGAAPVVEGASDEDDTDDGSGADADALGGDGSGDGGDEDDDIDNDEEGDDEEGDDEEGDSEEGGDEEGFSGSEDGEEAESHGSDAGAAPQADNDADDDDEIEVSLLDVFDASAASAQKKAAAAVAAAEQQLQQQRGGKGQRAQAAAGKSAASAPGRRGPPAEEEEEEEASSDAEEEEEEDGAPQAQLSATEGSALFRLLASMDPGGAPPSSSTAAGGAALGGGAGGQPSRRAPRSRASGPVILEAGGELLLGGQAAGRAGSGSAPDNEFGARAAGVAGKAPASAAASKRGAPASSAVDLGALVGALGTDDPASSGLRKRLQKLVDASSAPGPTAPSSQAPRLQPLAVPAPRSLAARASRTVAYEAAANDAGKWAGLVQANRQAPHLSFAGEGLGYAAPASAATAGTTLSAMADRFAPSNQFEAALAAALGASGLGALPGLAVAGHTGDRGVLASEAAELRSKALSAAALASGSLPLAPLSSDVVLRRGKELARMRALAFYEEERARRSNRIKSKAYRKLKQRADARSGAKERAVLEGGEGGSGDPAAVAALAEAEALLHARERMALKNRVGKGIGGSKWIRKVLAAQGGAEGLGLGGEAGHAADGSLPLSLVGGSAAALEAAATTRVGLLAAVHRAEALAARQGARPPSADSEEKEEGDSDSGSEGEDEGGAVPAGEEAFPAALAADLALLRSAQRRILRQVARLGEASGDSTAPSGEGAPALKGIMGMKFMLAAGQRKREGARAEALALVEGLRRDEARLLARAAAAGTAGGRAGSAFDELSLGGSEGDEESGEGSSDDEEEEGGEGMEEEREALGAVAAAEEGGPDGEGVASSGGRRLGRKARAAAAAAQGRAVSSHASAAATAGRRSFAGGAGPGGRPNGAATDPSSASSVAAVEEALGGGAHVTRVRTSAAAPIQVGELEKGGRRAGAKGAAAASVSETEAGGGSGGGNPWLSQGGVSYAAGADTPHSSSLLLSGGGAAPSAPNPWLDSAFDSSAGGGAVPAPGARVSRVTAGKRAHAAAAAAAAEEAAAGAAGAGGLLVSGVLDVSGSLSRLERGAAGVANGSAAGGSDPATAAPDSIAPRDKRRIPTGGPAAGAASHTSAPPSGGEGQPKPKPSGKQQGGPRPGVSISAKEQQELVRRAFGIATATASTAGAPSSSSAGPHGGGATAVAAGAGGDEEEGGDPDSIGAAKRADAVIAARDWSAGAPGVPGGPSRRGAAAAAAAATAVAGWGSWVGVGAASAEDQERDRLAAAARKSGSKWGRTPPAVAGPPPAPAPVHLSSLATAAAAGATARRADAGLATVVVSERRDRKLASSVQAASLPPGFTSSAQYERSMRVPLGPEWNSAAAVVEATRPELVTRAGVIIQPLRYEGKKKAPQGEAEAGGEGKRGAGKGKKRGASAGGGGGASKKQRRV